MKKGVISQSFIYIFAAIIMILILILGFSIFSKSKKYAEDVDIQSFVQTLNSKITKINGLEEGSESVFSYALPSSINKICFATNAKSSDADLISVYNPEKNLYMFPGNAYSLNEIYLENPICVSGNNLNLKLLKLKQGVTITSEQVSQKCNTLLFNKEDNLDILFISDSYQNINEFVEDSKEYVNSLLSKEPLKSKKQLLNFYSLNQFPDLGCTKDSLLICDTLLVQKAALDCPHDIIVVLSESGMFSGLRSTSLGNVISIATGDNNLVLSHELGHALGLSDEYTMPGFKSSLEDSPNCDVSPCEKWDKNGCFEGCSSSAYNRPSKDSIMKSYGLFSVNEFNEPSKEAMSKKLEVYE
ncbi:MAG: hypothetical protein PHT54_01580 [Candidatus Nanoarchaeia archaeon]|nr:hypothetical protein [Candidatus Nanoarchaeia archaeon]